MGMIHTTTPTTAQEIGGRYKLTMTHSSIRPLSRVLVQALPFCIVGAVLFTGCDKWHYYRSDSAELTLVNSRLYGYTSQMNGVEIELRVLTWSENPIVSLTLANHNSELLTFYADSLSISCGDDRLLISSFFRNGEKVPLPGELLVRSDENVGLEFHFNAGRSDSCSGSSLSLDLGSIKLGSTEYSSKLGSFTFLKVAD